MIIGVYKGRKRQPPKANKNKQKRKWYRIKPTWEQEVKLREILRFINRTKGQQRSYIYKKIKQTWNVEVSERRFTKLGGVGTYYWLPKHRLYRVQVGASKINANAHCFMYAQCIEF